MAGHLRIRRWCRIFAFYCKSLWGRTTLSAPFPVCTGVPLNAATPQPCLRRPTFSVLPEKVGKKMRRRRVILRAHAREFLAAPRPERPLRAQNCNHSNSLWFRQMYYTHLRADCINFGSAHFRNTRLVTILHYRRIRRWPAISTAGCFASFLRGSDSRWERCLHAGGAVV